MSENSKGACGEGFWLWARRRGPSIPAAGCTGRANKAHGQKTRRPKGFAEKPAWLRCSSVEDPPGIFSLVAPRHPGFSAKPDPFEFSDRLQKFSRRKNGRAEDALATAASLPSQLFFSPASSSMRGRPRCCSSGAARGNLLIGHCRPVGVSMYWGFGLNRSPIQPKKLVGRHGFAPCSRRLRAGTSLPKFAAQWLFIRIHLG